MINESGAVTPTESELEEVIDVQFAEKINKEDLEKCGLCNYFGNKTQMNYHRLGMGH